MLDVPRGVAMMLRGIMMSRDDERAAAWIVSGCSDGVAAAHVAWLAARSVCSAAAAVAETRAEVRPVAREELRRICHEARAALA